jgi:hypothetical protein
MASNPKSNSTPNAESDREDSLQSIGRKDLKLVLGTSPVSPFRKPQRTDSWKLSKEFINIDDQDELGNLIGDAGEKLLAFVDDIRKIDKLRIDELHIPQVCKCTHETVHHRSLDVLSW